LSQAVKEAVKAENKARVAPVAAAKKALETAQGKLKKAEDSKKPSADRIARRREAVMRAQEAVTAAEANVAATPLLAVKKLKQHVETRWNSVFVMLERLVLLRAPVAAVCASNTGEAAGKVRCAFAFVVIIVPHCGMFDRFLHRST
jgi:outer membrane PBP1 activator LpoA protein